MASILATIRADVDKFFSDLSTSAGKFSAAFVKWFGKAPAALQVLNNFLGEVAPVVEAAIALVDPVAEAPVAAALSMAETAIAALGASASAANSGTSVLANLENLAATVPSLLTGLQVKNPALQAKITSIANLVTNEAKVLIPAVESWVAQIAAGTTATAPAA